MAFRPFLSRSLPTASLLAALLLASVISCSDDREPPAAATTAGAAGAAGAGEYGTGGGGGTAGASGVAGQAGVGGAGAGGAGAAGAGAGGGAGEAGAAGQPATPGPRKPLWVRTFGGTNNDGVTGVRVMKDGAIVIAGGTESTIDFDGHTLVPVGGRDGFVAKLDPQGQALWAVSFGGLGEDAILDVEPDAQGNLYISGLSNNGIDLHDGEGLVPGKGDFDAFVAKLDANGNTLWSRRLGGTVIDIGWSVAPLRDGGVVLGGSRGSGPLTVGDTTFDPASGGRALLMVSLDDSGALRWVRSWDSPGEEQIFELVEGIDGDLWAQGVYTSTLSLDSIEVPYNNGEKENTYLARFSADGQPKQAWGFQGTGQEASLDLAVGPKGEIFFPITSDSPEDLLGSEAGPAHGAFDLAFLILDKDGQRLLARRLGTKGIEGAFGAAFDLDGNLLLSGGFSKGFSLAGQELEGQGLATNLLLKMDPLGNPLWWWAPGPTDLIVVENFNSVTVDPTSGDVVTAGRFILKLNGLDEPIKSKGKNDIYVARFAP